MQQTLNIVELIETNPITRLSNTYNIKLLDKIKNNFTDYEQQLFLTSFYCYLNYNKRTDFVIDLDNVWQWLGFSQKFNSKRLLEKYFVSDKDYKIIAPQVGGAIINDEDCKNTRGGHNKEIIMLNIETFKKFCMKAGTKKADEIHDYYLKLEEIIQETTEEQNTELQIQLQNKDHQLEMKTEELETIKTNKTTLYIYNMDTRVVPSEVKIGVTLNLHKRIKPYKQISKHGNVEFSVYLEDINVKSLEQYIHLLLKPYRVDGEVFRIDVEEAKCIMMGVVNRSKILSITNVDERQHKLLKLFEQERSIINDESIINISTRDMSCQTDFNDDVPLSYPIITTNVELYKKFDLYIEECCLIGENFEVNTDDIMGQFRIWNKKVSDDLKFAFLNYLKRRFSDENKDDYKLKKQDKNQVQYGYKGVMLKHIDYGKVVLTHDIEVFIYERCRFSSGGKSQVMTLINEYKDWKRTTNKPHVSTDEKELRKYLNNHPHLCASVVWKPTLKIVNEDGTTNEIKNKTQSNDGYYGISLKREDEHHYKNTSSKGKKVEKRDYATDTVLATYETIAKAMSETKITVLSTAIKNKRVFNNEYYFCIANKYV